MAVNKVIYNGETLINLTEDSVTPEALAEGVTAHDASGAVIRGAFTLANEMLEQDSLISRIKNALKGKAAGGGTLPTQEKIVDVAENGTVEIVPDEGYALSKVTANVNVESSGDIQVDELISNTLTDLDSNATSIRAHMFRGSTKLKTVNLPEVKSMGDYAFYSASSLEEVNMPKLETAGSQIFYTCNKLKSMVLPSLVSSGTYLFRDCTYIEFIDLPKLTEIEASMFNGCRSLKALILRSPTLVPLANTNAFTNCYCILGTKNNGVNPNGEKCGFIYVPAALIDEYRNATNWSADTLVTQLRAIEDYPDICGT